MNPVQGQNLCNALRSFVEEGALQECLVNAAFSAAQYILNDRLRGEELKDQSRDLAMDFLVTHVLPNKITDIQTVSGLKKEMLRFVTRRDSKESQELWGLLSEAIRALASDGLVTRLDQTVSNPNSNLAVWILVEHDPNDVLDVNCFRARAENVPVFYPARDGGRVITPASAKNLIVSLLKAAGARIPFGMVVDEAKRHVVLEMQHAESLEYGDSDSSEQPTHAVEFGYNQAVWIQEEAETRARAIWAEARQEDEKNEVLCRYFLPKYFLGEKITLQSLGGDFRRTGEKSKVIQALFARKLSLTKLGDETSTSGNEGFSDVVKELVGRVAEILLKKCSEKSEDVHFDKENEERDG